MCVGGGGGGARARVCVRVYERARASVSVCVCVWGGVYQCLCKRRPRRKDCNIICTISYLN